jgi:hypothetical protein
VTKKTSSSPSSGSLTSVKSGSLSVVSGLLVIKLLSGGLLAGNVARFSTGGLKK